LAGTNARTKREEYSYSRLYFQIRSAFYVVLLFSSALIFKGLSGDTLVWFILLVALLVGMLLIFGISPLFTNHWLTRTRLILRRGFYFRSIIPIKDIEKVEVYEGEPRIGLSLSTRSSILFLTSGRFDLLEIRLRKPKIYPQMLGLRARRIVINVDNGEMMLESLRSKIDLLAPVESDGPNP